MASLAATQTFEVFYTVDSINTWVDCEVVDVVVGTAHS